MPYPPDRGDRITTHHVLRHLRDRGDEVRVGCLAETAQDVEFSAAVATWARDVRAPRLDRRLARLGSLRGLFTGEALTLPFFRRRPLAAAVRRWLAEDPPDLVWVYSSSMAQYVLDWDGGRRVMQFAELDSDKWRQYAEHARGPARWIYAREARRLLEFERRVARTFDTSLVVSEVERELFRQHIPDVDPIVVPNGVDVEHFTSAGDQHREPHTIVFTGVMDYEPNVDGVLWFVAHCWPKIRERFADARFLVVGSRPAPRIRALASRPGIEVTGRVPTIPPWLDRAAVAVAPLRLARGVQNKVLEAMSMGLPVVASPQAARGLGEVPDDTLAVREGAAATTAAVLELLGDPRAARAMGARAAEFVRAHYRWERVYDLLDAILAGRARAGKSLASSGSGP